MSLIHVPVSYGELIDKITILEIKSEQIKDPAKVANVRTELQLLEETWQQSTAASNDVSVDRAKLKSINEALWDIEDRIRLKEADRAFDAEFIELARAVYVTNDQRSAVKREINLALGSDLLEEKSYEDYQ